MPFSHTKVVGPAGRFGARYGMSLRRKITQIEVKQRGKHRCPRCRSLTRMNKLAVGIWQCKRCGFTFAGGAWVAQTALGKTFTPEELKRIEMERMARKKASAKG